MPKMFSYIQAQLVQFTGQKKHLDIDQEFNFIFSDFILSSISTLPKNRIDEAN